MGAKAVGVLRGVERKDRIGGNKEMRTHRFAFVLALVVGLLGFLGNAFAADADFDREAFIKELIATEPSLSREEAERICLQAEREAREASALRQEGVGPEILPIDRPYLGPPEDLVPPGDLSPEDLKKMEEVKALGDQLREQGLPEDKVFEKLQREYPDYFHEKYAPGERDDVRLHELYQEGRPVGEAIEHHEMTPQDKERYREYMEKEHGGATPREMERYMPERQVEQPIREVERPTMEQREVYREPTERPAYEAPPKETTAPTKEHGGY